MSRDANVRSFEAIRSFRIALHAYLEAVQDILACLQVETQKTLDWFENDRLAYWPSQVRLAQDELGQAFTTLEIKQLTFDGGPKPACVEERQAVEDGKRRLRYAEHQVQTIRRLLPKLQHDADEFHGVLGKLEQMVESDLPRALLSLDRILAALERYATLAPPSTGGAASVLAIPKEEVMSHAPHEAERSPPEQHDCPSERENVEQPEFKQPSQQEGQQ